MKFLQIMALCLTLTSCESCEEKEWDTLPPKTQKGANTFGCYVNGALFVGDIKGFFFPPAGIPPLYAVFSPKMNSLLINCISSLGTGSTASIALVIDNPTENEYNALRVGYFMPGGIRDCYGFGCDNCGRVLITKFDTINRIVSGTFEFSGRCSLVDYDESGEAKILFTGDSIVQITNGRFDIKLSVDNE